MTTIASFAILLSMTSGIKTKAPEIIEYSFYVSGSKELNLPKYIKKIQKILKNTNIIIDTELSEFSKGRFFPKEHDRIDLKITSAPEGVQILIKQIKNDIDKALRLNGAHMRTSSVPTIEEIIAKSRIIR